MTSKVKVHLWSGLKSLTGGLDAVDVEASNIGEMLAALERECPELAELIESGVSVSIDGKIHASGLTAEIRPENEIYLLQRLKGG